MPLENWLFSTKNSALISAESANKPLPSDICNGDLPAFSKYRPQPERASDSHSIGEGRWRNSSHDNSGASSMEELSSNAPSPKWVLCATP